MLYNILIGGGEQVIMMSIKELRINKGLTQNEAAKLVGLSLRTYQNYEYGASTRDMFKINNIIKILNEYQKYSEDKGVLSTKEIFEICSNVFKKYNVSYAYLFGSYAKGIASEKSDIDILISDEVKGLEFIGLAEELCSKLHKKVDLIRIDDLKNNYEFLNEILATGVKIIGDKRR